MREFHRQPEVVLAVERMGSAIMLVALVEGLVEPVGLVQACRVVPPTATSWLGLPVGVAEAGAITVLVIQTGMEGQAAEAGAASNLVRSVL
jgi:hypothetical protein